MSMDNHVESSNEGPLPSPAKAERSPQWRSQQRVKGELGILPPFASDGEVPFLSPPEWVKENHYKFNVLKSYKAIHIIYSTLGELW